MGTGVVLLGGEVEPREPTRYPRSDRVRATLGKGYACHPICLEGGQPMSPDDINQYELFIDGEFAESRGTGRIEVEYPYDGEIWASVPQGTEADVDAAVSAAWDAFEHESWQDMLPDDRRKLLYQFADVVAEHADELAELETRQNGKLLREMSPQMDYVEKCFRYFGRQCDTVGRGRINPVSNKDGQMFNYVKHEPYGVVGAITPWNSPLLLGAHKLAPAIAAGNTVVEKPSEETPLSSLRFAELVHEETDIPDGVYNVVTGYGEEAGAALSDHPDIDKLAFTGSTEVGREIAANGGRNLTKVSLELGGKSPNVVFPSADLKDAINGIMKGIFSASGQTCVAGSRVLLHEDIHDEVVDRLIERAKDIKIGDPMDPETEVAPIAFTDQWEKIAGYIDAGVEEGATLTYGGEAPDDLPGELFFEPTIFTDVEPDMAIAEDEIFGPVASVFSFEDEAEAIELANDTDYGLAGAVWTENMRQAHRMVEKIRAGVVWVNNYRVLGPDSPIGGFKDSGLGREAGEEGLEEYYQSKTVWVDLSGEVGDPFLVDVN